jgi:hypothetical protein
LLDLLGCQFGGGFAFPGDAECVAVGVCGQGAGDAFGKVVGDIWVQVPQESVSHGLDRGTRGCAVLDRLSLISACRGSSARCHVRVGHVVLGL